MSNDYKKDILIIEQIRHKLLTVGAEVSQYESWGADFAFNEIRKGFHNKSNGWFLSEEIFQRLPRPYIETIFGKWEGDFYLIPLWLLHYIKHGEKATSIMGNVVEFGENFVDDDHRGGYLAYGWTHGNHKSIEDEEKSKKITGE